MCVCVHTVVSFFLHTILTDNISKKSPINLYFTFVQSHQVLSSQNTSAQNNLDMSHSQS